VRNSLYDLALDSSLLFGLSLCQLLLALDSWPIDTVSYWFSTSAEDWEWVEPWVGAKDLLPIFL